MAEDYFKGRGAQFNPKNPYHKHDLVQEHFEGLDEELYQNSSTKYYFEHPKKIVNKVDSPDVGMMYSINPYQGCEHGCIYCYARNSHQYWGFSAGMDFERNIIIKENAPELLETFLKHPKWKAHPILLSGNTDCYQPVERKKKLTRRLLEIFLKYKHPVAMITKNSLVLRDIDILSELAKDNLAFVNVSITSLNEDLRQKMEPRTATAANRLRVVRELTAAGVPVGVMTAPMIPGLNDHEMPEIIKRSAEAGAVDIGYTIVRLNGSIAQIFKDWVIKNFPDRSEKILNQIGDAHGGRLNDSRFGTRMRGEGEMADVINRLFKTTVKKYMKGRVSPELNCSIFQKPGQMELF